MKCRNLQLVAAALLLVLPALASAGSPTGAYDGWTVNTGVIDTSTDPSCNGDWTCKALSQDNGFLQQEITNSITGEDYIRIIMTEPDATGDPSLTGSSADLAFSNENYTAFYTNTSCGAILDPQNCQGIAVKQAVRDLAGDFENIAQLQRNFGKADAVTLAGMFNIDIVQTNNTIDPVSGLAFNSQFTYTDWSYWECSISGSCNTNQKIGSAMDISQAVATDETDASRGQVFEQRKREGWMGRQTGGWFQSAPVVDTGGATWTLDLGGSTTPINYDSNSGFAAQANVLETTYVASNTAIDGFVYQSVYHDGYNGAAVSTDFAERVALDMQGLNSMPLDPFDWDATNFGAAPVFPASF